MKALVLVGSLVLSLCATAMSVGFSSALSAGDLSENIRNTVKGNWSKISEECQEMMEKVQEMPKLPDHAFFSTDKRDQREKIRNIQIRIRELLLSEDSRKLMAKIDAFSEKIEARRKKVAELSEELQFYPENNDKLQRQIDDERAAIKQLEHSREQELAKVRKELDAIGLHMRGETGNTLFSLVNRGDLIDNVIVAKSIFEILNRLQGAMKGGDMLVAKRYFGVYVALTDVQILCYEQYLAKSRNGEWRKSLAQVESTARSAVASARSCIAGGDFTEGQCAIFQKNIAANNKMISGVQAYRKLLDSHEQIIDRKLKEVQRMRKLADNSYQTISGAETFAVLLQSSQAEFAAVLDLELPELDGLDDTVLQEQLQTITNMLDR